MRQRNQVAKSAFLTHSSALDVGPLASEAPSWIVAKSRPFVQDAYKVL